MTHLPRCRSRLGLVAVTRFGALAFAPGVAADAPPGDAAKPALVETPEVALRKLRPAPGLKVNLFAAEPDPRNPVAMSIDEGGRVFVVESGRRRSSVFDIRGRKESLEADFSFRTVRERAEFLQREVSPTNPPVIRRLTGGGRGTFADFNRDGVIDWRYLGGANRAHQASRGHQWRRGDPDEGVKLASMRAPRLHQPGETAEPPPDPRVHPSAEPPASPGYETALVALKNGTTYAGVVRKESTTELELNTTEDGLVRIKLAGIGAREKGPSAMPEELGAVLTRRELRDLVEFLATLE